MATKINPFTRKLDYTGLTDYSGLGIIYNISTGVLPRISNQMLMTVSSVTFKDLIVTNGATGTFTTADSKVVTVVSGIITNIELPS